MKYLYCLLASLMIISCGSGKKTPSPVEPVQDVDEGFETASPSTLIIMVDESVGKEPLRKAVAAYGAEIIYDYSIIPGMAIKIPDEANIKEAIRYFREIEGVTSVERDYVYHLMDAPSFGAEVDLSPADDGGNFVTLTDVVPDAILEIRYYGTYNFVGARIDGYEAPIAILTEVAADSLRAVSDELKAKGYRLKIFDAYRPQKAVDHFVRWAADVSDTEMKPYFYPDLDKSVLFEQGYIAEKSGHTRGSTVDLTLFDMATEREVDMGGTFDWFGPESHPDFCGNPETGEYTGDNSKSPTGRRITPEQFACRMLLRRAMLAHGFKPFDSEWWHFTLATEPYPDTYFSFPVR